jgi:hypothetical protein
MLTSTTARLSLIGLVLMLTLWLLAACGGAGEQQTPSSTQTTQQAPTTQSTQPAGGEGGATTAQSAISQQFVGEVPEINAYLALLVSSPQQAGASPQVRAYLCDGKSINEWLTGKEEPANTLDLSSDDGANLKGELSSNEATGTLTLADGRAFAFSIPQATGLAGLYNMTLNPNGQMSGTSEGGANTLEGGLGDRQQDGRYLLSGTITSAEGETQDFQALATPDASGEIRGIFVGNGGNGIGNGGNGGNGFKGGAKKGSGTGFLTSFGNGGAGGNKFARVCGLASAIDSIANRCAPCCSPPWWEPSFAGSRYDSMSVLINIVEKQINMIGWENRGGRGERRRSCYYWWPSAL